MKYDVKPGEAAAAITHNFKALVPTNLSNIADSDFCCKFTDRSSEVHKQRNLGIELTAVSSHFTCLIAILTGLKYDVDTALASYKLVESYSQRCLVIGISRSQVLYRDEMCSSVRLVIPYHQSSLT